MKKKYFGTDGVRGVANKDLTAELAFKLGRYGGYVLTQNTENPTFVVGRDTRYSGEMLQSALISGLMSVGVNIIPLEVIPTPGVAFMTRFLHAQGGVMISASHNPFEDNGIKFFTNEGLKLSDEIELVIESMMENNAELPAPIGNKIGRMLEHTQGKKPYVNFLKETITNRFDGMKIVIDSANGAASPIATKLFQELGATVIGIHNNPNGVNINVSCGSTHPEDLQNEVVKHGADLGLAFDGDADRLIAVNEKGELVDGDQILYVCAKGLKKKNLLQKDMVVSTVMSNFGFSKALEKEGISTVQTAVGDRYVLENMLENHYILGGEQSGHIIFLEHNTTGDGMLSALQLANIVKEENKTLSQLTKDFTVFPQVLQNVRVKDKRSWETNAIVQEVIKTEEAKLHGNGRILVRASGTEQLIRVMAEGESEETVQEVVSNISAAISEHC